VALKFDTQPDTTPHPPFWQIEAPWRLSGETSLTPLQALVLSRRNAVDLSTLCSTTLLIHVYASHWFEWRHCRHHKVSEGERGSVPRSEARKGWLYIVFTFLVCAFLLGLRFALDRAQVGLGLWRRECETPCLPSLDLTCDMNNRHVVLGARIKFRLFSVLALYRRPTCASWFHAWRAGLSGIWRHRVIHGIGQLNRCEGEPQFFSYLRVRTETDVPHIDFTEKDMARDDALHQNFSFAHTVAYLSASPHSWISADGFSTLTVTYPVTAYRSAARASSAIPSREAGTPTCTRRWVLLRRRPHRGWANRHVGTMALA
jgi:hypothetical protein